MTKHLQEKIAQCPSPLGRLAIELHYIKGFSLRYIAFIFHRKLSSVKKLQARTLVQMDL